MVVTKGYCPRYRSMAFVALGGLLYLWYSPGYSGLFLMGCIQWLLYVILSRRLKLVPADGKAVLVTGCDTGFGHALAKQLSEMGVTVFAGVLDENSPGAQELRRQVSNKQLHILQLDVTDRSQIDRAHRYVCSQVGTLGLWGLVNNAGFLGCVVDGEVQLMTVYRRCMEVNYLAAVEMCQVFLPLLRRAKGRIVNVCSLSGEVPLFGFAAYGASKAALNIFSKVMRLEVARWGVHVATIQPMGFKTNIFGNRGDWSRYREELFDHLSPEAREAYGETYVASLESHWTKMTKDCSADLCPVLEDMCHALMSVTPRILYAPGRAGWLLPFLYRFCPTAISDFVLLQIFQIRLGQ